MLGGLARVTDDTRRAPRRAGHRAGRRHSPRTSGWSAPNRCPRAAAGRRPRPRDGEARPRAGRLGLGGHGAARAVSDLFWFGRYAERAEDLLRLLLATRTVGDRDRPRRQQRPRARDPAAGGHPRQHHLPRLPPPGHVDDAGVPVAAARPAPPRHRRPVARRAVAAAQGVRDQLSEDVWMVLADIERALAALTANPYDQGLQLTDASERVLSGLLALAGIASENMVRDPGWYMLDTGRGLERALQVLALLKVTVGPVSGRPRPTGWSSRRVLTAVGVDRHLPPSLPRPARRRGPGRTAGARPAQPALGGLPAAADADRSAGHPEHLADRPAAAAGRRADRAGPQRRRPGRWPTRSNGERPLAGRVPQRTAGPAARRWPRPSATSTSSRRPPSRRCWSDRRRGAR